MGDFSGMPSRKNTPSSEHAINVLKSLLLQQAKSGNTDVRLFNEAPFGAPVHPSLSPSYSSSSTASTSRALKAKSFQEAIALRQVQQREVYRLANELVLCPTLNALHEQVEQFFDCVVERFLQLYILMQKTHSEFPDGPEKDPLCRSVQKDIDDLQLACGASVLRVAEIETMLTPSPDDGSPFPTENDIFRSLRKLVDEHIPIADDLTMFLEDRVGAISLMMSLQTYARISLKAQNTRLPLLILELRRRLTGIIDECKALEGANLQVDHLNDQRITRAILTQVWKGITTKQTLSLWLSEHPCPQPAMAAPEAKGDGGEKNPPRSELISDNDGVLLPKLVDWMIVQLTETEEKLVNVLVSVVSHVGQHVPSIEQQGSISDHAAWWFALVDRCLAIDMADLRADMGKYAPAFQGHGEAAHTKMEALIEHLRELAKNKLAKEKVVKMGAHQYRQRLQRIQASTEEFETALDSASSEEALSMMLKRILTSVGEGMAHIYKLFPPSGEEQEEKNDSNNSNSPQQKMLKENYEHAFNELHKETIFWVRKLLSRLVALTALPGNNSLTHRGHMDAVRHAMATALSVFLNHLSSEAVLRIVDGSLALVHPSVLSLDPWEQSLQGVEQHPMWATMMFKVGLWMGHWHAERAAKREAQKKRGKGERFTQPSHVALFYRAHTLFLDLARGATRPLVKQKLSDLKPALTAAYHHTIQRSLLLANTFNILSCHPAETAYMSVLPNELANALSADDVARAIVKRVTDEAAEEAKQESAHEALLGVLQNVDQSVNPYMLSSEEEQLKSVQALDVALQRKALKVIPFTHAYLRSVWGHTDDGKVYVPTADSVAQKTAPSLSWETSPEMKASQPVAHTPPPMIAANVAILLRLAARGLSEISRLTASDDASLREAADSLQMSAWPQAMTAALQLALLPATTLALRGKTQEKALSEHQTRMTKCLKLHTKMMTVLEPHVQRSKNAANKKLLLAPWLTTKAKQYCDRLLNNCTEEEKAVLQSTADAVQSSTLSSCRLKKTSLCAATKIRFCLHSGCKRCF